MFERLEKAFYEIDRRLHGLVRAAAIHNHDDTDKGRIAAVIANRVGYGKEFSGVFAGDCPVSGLVPIQNHALVLPARDHIPVEPNTPRFARNSYIHNA